MRQHIICLVSVYFLYFQFVDCWLFYSPASEIQTVHDCIHLKTTNSPFYPPYCDKLLEKHKEDVDETSEVKTNATPEEGTYQEGWGWSEWSDWISRACPEICGGRGCKKRMRVCQGTFEAACSEGLAAEYSRCDALNMTSTTGGSVETTEASSDDEYSQMNLGSEYTDDYEEGKDEEGAMAEDEEDKNSDIKERDRFFKKRKVRIVKAKNN